MTLSSMTGFARQAGEGAGFRWNWEIKSVNNKALETRCKLPAFLDGFDLRIKKVVASKLSRGSVYINLSVERDGDDADFVVNEDRLRTLIDVSAKYAHTKGVHNATISALLGIKGVVDLTVKDTSEEERAALEELLEESLREVLAKIAKARKEEGGRMQEVLVGQLNEIERLAQGARSIAGDRVDAMHKRFKQQLSKLETIDKPVSEDRLAQEIATMAVKADIQEELDRLDSHCAEARSLLAREKAVGRRLDFLCQEFNREANTLCSKSGDTALTKIGLDLKALIDQFREQVQNIE